MSELKDKIKKLIIKAKDSGDVDLLELAMDLLDEIPAPKPEDIIIQGPEQDRSKLPHKFSEFTMSTSKEPVYAEEAKPERVNKFVDNGTEHKDITTPEVSLTERRREPFKMVTQTCTRCNKASEVHPRHAREFFVCDKCLRR